MVNYFEENKWHPFFRTLLFYKPPSFCGKNLPCLSFGERIFENSNPPLYKGVGDFNYVNILCLFTINPNDCGKLNWGSTSILPASRPTKKTIKLRRTGKTRLKGNRLKFCVNYSNSNFCKPFSLKPSNQTQRRTFKFWWYIHTCIFLVNPFHTSGLFYTFYTPKNIKKPLVFSGRV